MIHQIEEIKITKESYPFCSAKKYGYLDAFHYQETEYYMHGTANIYETAADNIQVRTPDAPYVNRFVVRKPETADACSGNVIVEIINPTSFIDLERIWVLGMRQIMRNGDIYVGITSKPNTIKALLAFDKERYQKLDWSNPTREIPFPFTAQEAAACHKLVPDQNIDYETGLIWDMLTDLAALFRSGNSQNPLRENHPHTLVLSGWSQSAGYLVRYANDFAYRIERERPVYDGYFAAAPPRYVMAPVNQYETLFCVRTQNVQLKRMRQPCIIFQTESENTMFGGSEVKKENGNDANFMCRYYEITGASHDTQYSLLDYYQNDPDLERIGFRFQYGGKDTQPNHYPYQLLVHAMLHHLFLWIHENSIPIAGQKIQTDSAGNHRKDAFGNSIGGIRTCLLDYPTGRYYPYSRIDKGGCPLLPDSDKDWLFGHEEPFSKNMLQELYGNLEHYRTLAASHTAQLVRDGFLLREDAEAMTQEAVTRARARGLR